MLTFLSCNQSQQQVQVLRKDTVPFINVGDTLKYTIKDFSIDSNNLLEPDYFPVTDEMIDRFRSVNSQFELLAGDLRSVDQAWFRNKGMGIVLVIGMYTDGFRTAYVCFRENEIPDGILKALEIIRKDEMADIDSKRRYLSQFIGQSQEMGSSICRSAKAFLPGENCRKRAIEIYGSPDSVISEGKFQRLSWSFPGELIQLKNPQIKKPYARNSFGYMVEMYFREEGLVAMILSNEIP